MTGRQPGESRHPTPTSDDWFRLAFDAILDHVAFQTAVRDEAGTIVDFRLDWVNAANLDAAGRPREQVVGRLLSELYPAMATSGLLRQYAEVVITGEPLVIPVLSYDDVLDGERVSGYYTVQVTRFGDGVIVAARDITAQETDRRRLVDALDELAAAQELAKLGSWRVGPGGQVSLSPGLHELCGYSPEEVGEWDAFLRAVIHPDDLEQVTAVGQQALSDGAPFSLRHRLVRADGTVRVVRSRGVPVIEDDQVVGLWGTLQDVSEQVTQAAALRQAEREAASQRSALETLQRALLPSSLPQLDGYGLCAVYEPAEVQARVGGDWYDAFTVEDQLVLVVGDVAGHGFASAGVMGQARSALRAYAHQDPDPGYVLTALNRLGGACWPELFVTALVVTVDEASGRLRYARAGHPPPLRLSRGGATYLDGAGGPLLGPFPSARHSVAEDRLEPGDRLLLFTDGLVERRDRPIDVGLAGLIEQAGAVIDLPLGDLCDHIRRRVLGPGASHDDDISVLAVERVPMEVATAAAGTRGRTTTT